MSKVDAQRTRLVRASDAAYQNAVATVEDAKLLHSSGRYARAKALAILAEEEFAKALMLHTCATQGRWDPSIRGALKVHQPKQGISHAARLYFSWVERNAAMVADMNRHALIPGHIASTTPSDAQLSSFLKAGSATIDGNARDIEKQDALYVRIDKTGAVIADPASVGAEEASACIEDAEIVRRFVESLR